MCTVVIPEEVGQADSSNAVHAPKDAAGGRTATGKRGKEKKKSKTTAMRHSQQDRACGTKVRCFAFCPMGNVCSSSSSLGESRLRGAHPWTSYADATHRRRRRCLAWLGLAPSRSQSRAVPWLQAGRMVPECLGSVLRPFGNTWWQLISIVRGLRSTAVGTTLTVPATA